MFCNKLIDRFNPTLIIPIRQLLFVNNLILALCSILLAGFSFLVCALFWKGTGADSIFANWLALGLVGLSLMSICIIGMRGAHLVSLELLLFYFWGVAMFIGPLILATVAGFDFINYIEIWFKHSWETPVFEAIRAYFCDPGTADAQCTAPLLGGPNYDTVTEWCLALYNATNCQSIRDAAEKQALLLSRKLIITQAFISVFNVLQIALSIYICNKILTAPVITQSMNDTINYLLVLPIGGCLGISKYLWWMRHFQDSLSMFWAPYLFLLLGVIMVCQVPLGIVAGRLKSRVLLAGSMLLLSFVLVGLIICGILCLVFAVAYNDNYTGLTSGVINDIACINDLVGCCCCSEVGVNRCPEWTQSNVIAYLTLTLKVSGVIALLATLYYIGALIVSELLRRNLKNYKSGFI